MAPVLPDRGDDRCDREHEQHARDRPRQEEPGIRVAHDRADQVDLDLVAEDHAEDERREREPELHHQVAEHAEHREHVDVADGVVERVGADHAQHQHHREQHPFRDHDDVQRPAHPHQQDRQHDRVREDVRREHPVRELGVLRDEERPRLDAVDRERAEHDRGHRVAGDAERHDGHQRPGHVGVVRRLRGDDPLRDAGAELLGMARELLRLVVGEHVGGAAADRRQHADHQPDERRPEQQERARHDLPDHLAVRHHETDRAVRALGRGRRAAHALHLRHDLAEGEHPDQHRQEGDAALDEADPEGEPRLAEHRVAAEHGHDEAERAREQALGERGLDQARDHRQREHEEREVFPRAELEREPGERPGRADEDDRAEQPAEDRRPDAEPERAAGLALAHHRVAVERRRDRGRLARDAEQARGDQPAGLAADVDADHRREPLQRLEPEGERQHDDDRQRDRDARQRAAHHADQGAEEERQQVLPLQHVDDAGGEELVHQAARTRSIARAAGAPAGSARTRSR